MKDFFKIWLKIDTTFDSDKFVIYITGLHSITQRFPMASLHFVSADKMYQTAELVVLMFQIRATTFENHFLYMRTGGSRGGGKGS